MKGLPLDRASLDHGPCSRLESVETSAEQRIERRRKLELGVLDDCRHKLLYE